MLGNFRGQEWIIILLIILLLFGARKLPDLARGVGRSMKIFRSEVKDLKSDDAAPPAPEASPYTADAPAPSPTDTADDSEPQQP